MKTLFILSLMASALWLAAGCARRGEDAAAKAVIPKIARLGGIHVGYSTQEDLAKRWGVGKTITGGHPNSGRLWRIKGTPWVLRTDGFDYSHQGLVVDGLEIYENPGGMNDVPFAKLSKNDFIWLGGISMGISKAEAMRILQREAPSFAMTKDGFETSAEGFHALESSIPPLKTWTASLGFTNGLLNRFTLSASQ